MKYGIRLGLIFAASPGNLNDVLDFDERKRRTRSFLYGFLHFPLFLFSNPTFVWEKRGKWYVFSHMIRTEICFERYLDGAEVGLVKVFVGVWQFIFWHTIHHGGLLTFCHKFISDLLCARCTRILLLSVKLIIFPRFYSDSGFCVLCWFSRIFRRSLLLLLISFFFFNFCDHKRKRLVCWGYMIGGLRFVCCCAICMYSFSCFLFFSFCWFYYFIVILLLFNLLFFVFLFWEVFVFLFFCFLIGSIGRACCHLWDFCGIVICCSG